jgi:uncharacterized membrane protein YvbJ
MDQEYNCNKCGVNLSQDELLEHKCSNWEMKESVEKEIMWLTLPGLLVIYILIMIIIQ